MKAKQTFTYEKESPQRNFEQSIDRSEEEHYEFESGLKPPDRFDFYKEGACSEAYAEGMRLAAGLEQSKEREQHHWAQSNLKTTLSK